jgi:phosphoserine aminotransferase
MNTHSPIINFGAGPAALPQVVLTEAAEAVINYKDSGLSILEIPHRGGQLFEELLSESKALVLELCQLNADDYEVLWLQGGGRLQFAMIPMNFLDSTASAGYIDSGYWAHDAQEHARQYGNVRTIATSRALNYTMLPEIEAPIPNTLSYLHYTTNNTIYGSQFSSIPESPVPLFADMSSDIFAQHRDYSRFDLFYAVAQKNLGAAGVTLVVIKKSLLGKIVRKLPPILDYQQQVMHHSVLNTPPVFGIYVSLLVLRWIKEKGIDSIEKENNAKATLLYKEIERNTLLEGIVQENSRSKMNVVFRTSSSQTEKELISFCKENGIEGIGGHRSVGGLRVSLYNAITLQQVEKLVSLLQQFEQEKLKHT